MLTECRWLALEAKSLDRARSFYVDHLDLSELDASTATDRVPDPERDDQVALDVGGGTALVVRRPTRLPRGGLHTHYALSVPADEYDDWYARLSGSFDLDEHSFGSVRSLYLYDPAGHCVELAGTDVEGPGVDGVFEVVLEVADLERAESFYGALGFEPIDSQHDRIRMRGPVDLELWEPRLGLADARGGVHVDLGFGAEDPAAAVDAVRERARSVEETDRGIRVWDQDGHAVEFR